MGRKRQGGDLALQQGVRCLCLKRAGDTRHPPLPALGSTVPQGAGQRSIAVEHHAERCPALRQGAQSADIAEHLAQRHLGRQVMRRRIRHPEARHTYDWLAKQANHDSNLYKNR